MVLLFGHNGHELRLSLGFFVLFLVAVSYA